MISIALIATLALAAAEPPAAARELADASEPAEASKATNAPASEARVATMAPAAAPAAQAKDECDCESFGRTGALSVLGGGILLGVTSLVAFDAGFDAERQLRSGEARGVDEQNAALTQRAVAAWVAWPTAVLSVAGVLGGGWLVAQDGAP